jgi:cyclase
MPMKRLIGGLILRDGIVVQSIGFCRYLPVGRPEIVSRFYDHWGADEIVLLDIEATDRRRPIDPTLVDRVARVCRAPLTAGGGLSTVEDVRRTIAAGADKVAINAAIARDPALVSQVARYFGNQALVAVIDYRINAAGQAEVFADNGRTGLGITPEDQASRLEAAGAGEILLHAIDRDGQKTGFDLDVARRVAARVRAPLIVMGGAGHPDHFRAALREASVSATAAGNYWHYTEHTISVVKAQLAGAGIPIRYESQSDYREFAISPADGRIIKRPDDELARMIFEYLPEEPI